MYRYVAIDRYKMTPWKQTGNQEECHNKLWDNTSRSMSVTLFVIFKHNRPKKPIIYQPFYLVISFMYLYQKYILYQEVRHHWIPSNQMNTDLESKPLVPLSSWCLLPTFLCRFVAFTISSLRRAWTLRIPSNHLSNAEWMWGCNTKSRSFSILSTKVII